MNRTAHKKSDVLAEKYKPLRGAGWQEERARKMREIMEMQRIEHDKVVDDAEARRKDEEERNQKETAAKLAAAKKIKVFKNIKKISDIEFAVEHNKNIIKNSAQYDDGDIIEAIQNIETGENEILELIKENEGIEQELSQFSPEIISMADEYYEKHDIIQRHKKEKELSEIRAKEDEEKRRAIMEEKMHQEMIEHVLLSDPIYRDIKREIAVLGELPLGRLFGMFGENADAKVAEIIRMFTELKELRRVMLDDIEINNILLNEVYMNLEQLLHMALNYNKNFDMFRQIFYECTILNNKALLVKKIISDDLINTNRLRYPVVDDMYNGIVRVILNGKEYYKNLDEYSSRIDAIKIDIARIHRVINDHVEADVRKQRAKRATELLLIAEREQQEAIDKELSKSGMFARLESKIDANMHLTPSQAEIFEELKEKIGDMISDKVDKKKPLNDKEAEFYEKYIRGDDTTDDDDGSEDDRLSTSAYLKKYIKYKTKYLKIKKMQ